MDGEGDPVVIKSDNFAFRMVPIESRYRVALGNFPECLRGCIPPSSFLAHSSYSGCDLLENAWPGLEDGGNSHRYPYNRIAFELNELIVRWTTSKRFRPSIRKERERDRIDNSEIASESGIRSRGCARCQGLESNGRTPVCAFLLRVIYAPMPIELCSPFPYPPGENGVGLDRRLNSIEHPVLLASNKEAAFLLPNSIFPFRA